MNRSLLLLGASVLALCAGGAAAAVLPAVSFSGKINPSPILRGAKVLYNQNSNDAGDGINSQNFTGGTSSSYTDQSADDFVIPQGQTWRVTEVDVTGAYFNGSGPATSENVIFYKSKYGMPGVPITNGMFTNLDGTGGPDFAIVLPGRGLKLRAGHYWVSVIANMAFDSRGEWGWEVNSVQRGKQAMWQNPGGGFHVCQTWGTIESCVSSPGPDLMFDLRGRVK